MRMNGPTSAPTSRTGFSSKIATSGRTEDEPGIADEAPDSALTERSLEQIAADAEIVWTREGLESGALRGTGNGSRTRGPFGSVDKPSTPAPSSGARSACFKKSAARRIPGFIAPQLAQQARQAPDGNGWIHD